MIKPTKKTSKKKVLKTIGTTDVIDLPEVGIFDVPCKIDTGADTSAIHCDEVLVREIGGKRILYFKLLDINHPLYTGQELCTDRFKEKKVKSSFGKVADRFQVRLKVQIYGKKYLTNFNLSQRPEMNYPILLGKRFLKNRFVVDVAQKDLNVAFKKNLDWVHFKSFLCKVLSIKMLFHTG